MGLPAWLNVKSLKDRIDVETSGMDTLFAEWLEEVLDDVQGPPPLGTGRLLVPDPAPDLVEGVDQAAPVTRLLRVGSDSRVLLPDAREVTAVTVNGEAVAAWSAEEPLTPGYKLHDRDGVHVQLEIPRVRCAWSEWVWEPISAPEPGVARQVAVTGRFGFAGCGHDAGELSPRIRGAIYELGARKFYERQSGYADTVAVGEGAAASIYSRAIPAHARLALEGFALPDAYVGLS